MNGFYSTALSGHPELGRHRRLLACTAPRCAAARRWSSTATRTPAGAAARAGAALLALCRRYARPLVINDHLDLCMRPWTPTACTWAAPIAVELARTLLGPARSSAHPATATWRWRARRARRRQLRRLRRLLSVAGQEIQLRHAAGATAGGARRAGAAAGGHRRHDAGERGAAGGARGRHGGGDHQRVRRAAAGAGGGPFRRPVLDDDPLLLQFIAEVLGHAGYDTLAASSGEEALRLVAQGEPDMALLDITMPGMSGLELAATSKPKPRCPSCSCRR
jgi:hypothetical protein